jgi:hypothetical protein
LPSPPVYPSDDAAAATSSSSTTNIQTVLCASISGTARIVDGLDFTN